MKRSVFFKRICLFAAVCVFPFASVAQTKGSFVDARDGQEYSTVTYTFNAADSVISDADEYGTYVAKKPVKYRSTYTGLMLVSITWMTQNLNFEMAASRPSSASGSDCDSCGRLYTWEAATAGCPVGWHLPSDDEWYLLAGQFGGVALAGEHLKSTRLNGTNKSMFDVLKPTIFWSSSELDTDNALDWKVNFRWVKLQRWKGGKKAYNSVRCVQDY